MGKAVRVVVNREGATQTLLVTLGRREAAEAAEPASQPVEEEPPAAMDLMGLPLSPLSAEIREQLELPDSARGLAVMDVDETSEAFEKGLRAGDVLTEAGQTQVITIADLQERIEEASEAGRKSILLLVRRDGDPRFVALSIASDE